MNRVGYSGAKIYYTCLTNLKKYTSKYLAGCIRTDWKSFCFWHWWDNKIKSPNVRFPHTNFFWSPASTQSMCSTTLCPSWHSVQSPSCSQFSSQYLINQKPDSSSFYSSSHILFILCTTLFKACFFYYRSVCFACLRWMNPCPRQQAYLSPVFNLQLQWVLQI